MSEDVKDEPKPEADAPKASTAVAVQQPKAPRLISESDVAIWDTASFEHLGRVAVVMADSGLASETFYKDGDKEAPRQMVIARMLMVATVARDTGANPLMFLQTCSIISRKLHIEGKAVNAIIRKRTGVVLRFKFGLWDTDHIVFPELVTDQGDERFGLPVDPDYFNGVGERLAVRAFDPEDPERYVDGSVGLWKTDRRGSPWSNPGNWRRQLRYRGAPEWARAYEPGAVLGIFSDADEDLDGFDDGGAVPKKRNLRGKLTEALEGQEANPADTGFDRNHVAAETGEDQTQDAEFEEVGDPKAAEGHAAPGETYLHLEDSIVTDDGKRMTFKDGSRFSALGEKGTAGLKVYAQHAPEIVEEAEAPQTQAPAVAPSVEAANDTTGFATPASGNSQEGTSGQQASDEAQETGSDAQAGNQSAVEPTSGRGFLASLESMNTWAEIKTALGNMMRTSDWQGADPADQEELRCAVWAEVERVRADHGDKVDQAEDITAFNLWIATLGTSRDDADAMDGTFQTIKRSAVWGKLKPEQQKTIEDRVSAKLKRIRG